MYKLNNGSDYKVSVSFVLIRFYLIVFRKYYKHKLTIKIVWLTQLASKHYVVENATKLYLSRKVKVLYWPEAHGLIGRWECIANTYALTLNVTHWITGCGNECSLEAFTQRSEPYRINDMDKVWHFGFSLKHLDFSTATAKKPEMKASPLLRWLSRVR